MNIDSGSLFAPVYNRVFSDIMSEEHEHERWTFTGGRASCKSSCISIVIVVLVVLFPFLNVVIVRRYAKTLRYSVFEQIKWAIKKLTMNRNFWRHVEQND